MFQRASRNSSDSTDSDITKLPSTITNIGRARLGSDSSTSEDHDLYVEFPNDFSEVTESKKFGKVWEFLRGLLQDRRTCPSLIKWENYDEGMFKFVKREEVARMWGLRNRNCKMDYGKLSRAMRYYYKTKVLLPVHGKKLVYKFGPNATGWRTENPILL